MTGVGGWAASLLLLPWLFARPGTSGLFLVPACGVFLLRRLWSLAWVARVWCRRPACVMSELSRPLDHQASARVEILPFVLVHPGTREGATAGMQIVEMRHDGYRGVRNGADW